METTAGSLGAGAATGEAADMMRGADDSSAGEGEGEADCSILGSVAITDGVATGDGEGVTVVMLAAKGLSATAAAASSRGPVEALDVEGDAVDGG
jgi:hypothetical protein